MLVEPPHETIESALPREKAPKAWKRSWKIEMIEAADPAWDDLFALIA